MKRLVGSFVIALLLHGAVGYVLTTQDFSEVRLNVRSGVTSVQMTFQSPANASESVSELVPEETKPSTSNSGPAPEKTEDKEPPEQSNNEKQSAPDQSQTEKPSGKTGDRPGDQPKTSSEESSTNENQDDQEPAISETTADVTTHGKQPSENEEPPKEETHPREQSSGADEARQETSATHQDVPEAPENAEKEVLKESAHSDGVKWKEKVDYLHNPAPAYPTRARIMGIEGRVKLLVTIGENGTPTEVEIYESSGSHTLDQAAKEAVKSWEFKPAQEDGQAHASRTIVPIRFQLD